ncbi:MAG: hypothetical protein HY690_00760 [Chloroflexi bacterium]|nr:hypothetical protein [Chloroflexota bacterium]
MKAGPIPPAPFPAREGGEGRSVSGGMAAVGTLCDLRQVAARAATNSCSAL